MRNRIRKQSIAPHVLFLKRKRDIVANGSAKVAGAQITSEVFSGYRKDTLKIKKATENLEAVDFKSGTIFWTTNKN